MTELAAIFILWTLIVASVVAVEVKDRCLAEQAERDWTDSHSIVGDVPVIPSGLKTVFHAGSNTGERQHDHV